MGKAYRASHHRRDLEDDEWLSRRDLDADEFFGREYDVLAERDLFKNAYDAYNAYRTIKALGGYSTQKRVVKSNALTRRDLDAEELFGREYDSDDYLVERDFFDGLD